MGVDPFKKWDSGILAFSYLIDFSVVLMKCEVVDDHSGLSHCLCFKDVDYLLFFGTLTHAINAS